MYKITYKMYKITYKKYKITFKMYKITYKMDRLHSLSFSWRASGQAMTANLCFFTDLNEDISYIYCTSMPLMTQHMPHPSTVCPRSLVHFYVATSYMKMDKASWTF